jgi:hypothetical protein
VRLADWLGPRDELVPIGRPTPAPPIEPDNDDAAPPTAAAFWSEDSAALHDALQAPIVDPWRPTARRRPGLRRILSMPGTAIDGIRSALAGGRLRWALLALPIAALALVALVGSTEGPTGTPSSGHVTTTRGDTVVTNPLTADSQHRRVAASVLVSEDMSRIRRLERQRVSSASRSRSRSVGGRAARRRPHVTRTAVSAAPQQPETTPAPTYASAPASSSPSTGASMINTVPSTNTGSPSSSTHHTATSTAQPAFGENGTLGPGSSPDS